MYDGFGRLRQVKASNNLVPPVVEEFRYNGLGHRISWKYDTDVDGDVDGSDKTYRFAYDERWRVVATYRESDASPKEQFIYHCAGLDGQGGSSYIDAVILRDQDANSNWVTSAGDGVLEKRDFYCQNWRADVVALITASGGMGGWVKYSAYGIPYGIPAGDTNGDGVVNSTDSTNATSWAGTGAGATHPTADINLDGDINSTDQTAIGGVRSGVSLGWGKLSEASATSGGAAGGNRKGYAGYEFDPILADSNWHVRHRVLKSDLGRWMRRDPLGYNGNRVDFYVYANNRPMDRNDPTGLACIGCNPKDHAEGPCGRNRDCGPPGINPPGTWPNPNPPMIQPLPGQEINPPLSVEICCNHNRLAWQLQDPNHRDLYGMTACCGGVRVTCVFDDVLTHDYPTARPFIHDCVSEHEMNHAGCLNCNEQPDTPNGVGGKWCCPSECIECWGYRREEQCIATKCGGFGFPELFQECDACKNSPNPKQCNEEMRRYARDTKRKRHDNCVNCSTGDWTDLPRPEFNDIVAH